MADQATPATVRVAARGNPRRTAQGSPAAAVLCLQRAAGNAAVSRYLQRDGDAGTKTGTPTPGQPVPTPAPVPATVPPRKNYVFLMGDTKRDNFYIAADEFFKQNEKGAEIVRDKKTLADVIAHVNAGGTPALKIIIVSHANEAGNLGFSLDAADLKKDTSTGDHKPRAEFKELRDANASGMLPTADVAKIDASTQIDIKGCNIGRSKLMLDALDRAFGGAATVTAPTHKQEYSFHSAGKGKPIVTEEALFQYSIEDPGHPTVGAADRATRFKAKYPDVPAAEWPKLLRAAQEHHDKRAVYEWKGPNPPADDAAAVFARIGTAKLFPAKQGWTVAYKGRTVIGDKYQFEVQADRVTSQGSETQTRTIVTPIPPDGETLKAKEIADSGRPDAYLWTVEDKIQGGTLIRTIFSEHTEWLIDKKVTNQSGVAHPPTSDTTFYGKSTYAPVPPPTP
jgi:hypothetical protein